MPLLKDVNGKPKNFAITQEELKNYKPPSNGICYSIVFGCLFVACAVISILFFVSYSRCFEWIIPYNSSSNNMEINVEQDITKKIIIYYAFDSFYQNHRRFISSKDENQLKGKGKVNLKNCDPRIYDNENADVIRNPCGLIAATQFNDSFVFFNSQGDEVAFSDDNIIRNGDAKLYKNTDGNAIDVTDPHFIVWMRIAAFPYFRKKYGVFEKGLSRGTYTVRVTGDYPVPPSGTKYLVLSTETALGRKNPFLAYAFAAVGFVCFVFSFITFGYHHWENRKRAESIKLLNL